MEIVTTFDPTVSSSGTANFVVKNGGKVLFINESYVNLKITFLNSQNFYLPANDRRLITLAGQMSQPGTTINWTQLTFLAQPNVNVNNVIIESYAPGEEVPEIYPSPLLRQLNAAGAVGQLISQNANQCFPMLQGDPNDVTGTPLAVQMAVGGLLQLGPGFVNTLNGSLDVVIGTPDVVNGTTSGLINIFTPFGNGTCFGVDNRKFKLVVMQFSAYVSNQQIYNFTNPFSNNVMIWSIVTPNISLRSGGVAQNHRWVTGFFTSGNGTVFPTDTWGNLSVGSAVDNIMIGAGGPFSGAVVLLGV